MEALPSNSVDGGLIMCFSGFGFLYFDLIDHLKQRDITAIPDEVSSSHLTIVVLCVSILKLSPSFWDATLAAFLISAIA